MQTARFQTQQQQNNHDWVRFMIATFHRHFHNYWWLVSNLPPDSREDVCITKTNNSVSSIYAGELLARLLLLMVVIEIVVLVMVVVAIVTVIVVVVTVTNNHF